MNIFSASFGLSLSCLAISSMVFACGDAGTIGGAGGDGGSASTSTDASADAVSSSTTTSQTAGVTTSASSGAGGATPIMELLHEEGRFDTSIPDKPRFTWPGTSIGARFSGGCQEIKVNLDVDLGVPEYKIWFQVEVDGAPTKKFVTNQGTASYSIATDLSNGAHDLRIVRLNEGWLGKVSFVSFSTTGCAQVESPVPHVHAIEYIGDSTTCGYGDEGTAPCSFTAETESAYETYASIAARNLDATAHFIAYSGKGVYQNSDGSKTQIMPELYLRTLWNDGSPTYDFSLYDPDLVVLNLGTNDFSHPIDDQTFVDAYKSMLAEIRQRRPSATIVCIIWSKWGAAHDALVTQAVNEFADSKVLTTVFDRLPTEPSGCDGHPTVMTHARLGDQLTTFVQSNLGW